MEHKNIYLYCWIAYTYVCTNMFIYVLMLKINVNKYYMCINYAYHQPPTSVPPTIHALKHSIQAFIHCSPIVHVAHTYVHKQSGKQLTCGWIKNRKMYVWSPIGQLSVALTTNGPPTTSAAAAWSRQSTVSSSVAILRIQALLVTI